MLLNYPPDDFTLNVWEWLETEVYPNHLQEIFDRRAAAVWIAGSNGWVSLWLSDLGVNDPPEVRRENLKHVLFKRIFETKFPPPVPERPPLPEQPKGQLKIALGGFTRSSKLTLPLVCHLMEGFSKFTRDPDYIKRLLDTIASAGYDAVRTLDILGWYDGGWGGKEVTPVPSRNKSGNRVEATPNYYQQLENYILECHSRGLALAWSRGDLQLLSHRQLEEHFTTLGQLGVPSEAVFLFEGCNEAWQNGAPDPSRLLELVRLFKRQRPEIICGLSCPTNASEEPADFREWTEGADITIIHNFRGGEDTDRIRHIFSNGYEGMPMLGRRVAWQNEPPGPDDDDGSDDVTVGDTSDPEALGAMAAVSFLARQAWTYMSGDGVFLDGSPFEEQPAFSIIPKIRALIPPDVMAYPMLVHGGRDNSVLITPNRQYSSEGGEIDRIDQAISDDGKVVAVAYGRANRRQAEIMVDDGRRFEGMIINPGTAEVHELRIAAGERVPVDFRFSRLLIGQVT